MKAIIIATIIIVAAIAGGAYYYLTLPVPPEKKEILIGAVLSLTGTYADPGNHMLRAYRLWEEEVNAKGGIYVADLRWKLPVRIIVYDDTSDAETCTRMYEKLITVDNVDLCLGTYASVCWYAASTVVEKYKMPTVCGSGLSTRIYLRGYKYIFLTKADETTKLISSIELLMELPADIRPKTFIMYQDDTPAARDIIEYGAAELEKAGFKVILTEFYPKGTTEFLPLLLKYKALNPDAIIGMGYHKETATQIRIMKEIGWCPKFVFTSSGPQVPEFIKELGKDAEYVCTSTGIVDDMPESYSPGLRRVIEALKAKGYPVSWTYVAGGYSACEVLQAAIEKAGSIDREKLRDALLKLDMKCTVGPVKFDERGLNIKARWFVGQVQHGKFVIVSPKEFREAFNVTFWYPCPPWRER